MNAFLLYVVQSALCLSLFYGLYLLLLRREAFFRFNRCVLLTIMIVSMVAPLIRISVNEPALMQLPMIQLEEKVSSLEFNVSGWAQQVNDPELETSNLELETPAPRSTFNMIPLMYLAGLIASLALAIVSIISVLRIIVTARPVVYRQQKILVSPMKISSFTFAGWIVLPEMDYERFAAEIVTHEEVHRREGHFWDLCLAGIITVLHWFNPLVWLLQREIKALHEYEADRSTLTQGINATRYQLLLIEKAAGASRYSVASSFAQSKIKKRISMMNKQNPKPWAQWKALLFIPLAALLVQAFARPEIKRELEQISTLKSTEKIQENTSWNEDRFYEELRKSLSTDVSHELNHEDTWKGIVNKYHFLNLGKLNSGEGVTIKINKNGAMMVNAKRVTMDEIPGLVVMNLVASKESNFFKSITSETINGKEANKVIRYTLIEKDLNTPADDYQKLLNSVGEAYISKRDDVARQYYQTGYAILDTEKKAVIDNLVPILVMTEVKGDFSVKGNSSKTYVSKEDMDNHEIIFNGKTIKFKDVDSEFPDQFKKERIFYMESKNKNMVSLIMTPASSYILNEKWVSKTDIDVMKIVSINTYAPDEAVKRYGSKAKAGIIAVTIKE